jgi:hypothetical protein
MIDTIIALRCLILEPDQSAKAFFGTAVIACDWLSKSAG